MDDSRENAIVGAAGGAGAVAGGAIGVLFDGDLILGLLLAVGTGAILSGTVLLYVSLHRGSIRTQQPNVAIIVGAVLASIGLVQVGRGVVSDSPILALLGLAMLASGRNLLRGRDTIPDVRRMTGMTSTDPSE